MDTATVTAITEETKKKIINNYMVAGGFTRHLLFSKDLMKGW